MKSYKTLIVWQKSLDVVEEIYKVTANFPESEKFGLVSQMRRCAVSVPSNIAEGHGRQSNGDLIRFLKIAFGSSSELETQIEIARRLGFLSEKEFDTIENDLIEVRKMLNKFIHNLLKANN